MPSRYLSLVELRCSLNEVSKCFVKGVEVECAFKTNNRPRRTKLAYRIRGKTIHREQNKARLNSSRRTIVSSNPGCRRSAVHERTSFLQILVEYDDVEWQRREWLSPHRDAVFSFFLVEKGLYWAERPDPRHASLIAIDHHNHANNNHHHHRINGKPLRGATAVANTVAWPALVSAPCPSFLFSPSPLLARPSFPDALSINEPFA